MRSTGPRVALAIGLAAGLAFGTSSPAQEIALERHDGELHLVRIPDVLSPEGVRDHLDSGLTSTLHLRVTVRSGSRRVEAEGWIAVRYDLWDEVYRVASRGLLGNRRAELASFEELVSWWRSPRARLPTGDLGPSEAWTVRIDVELIPFSSDEERDAQRWVTESLRSSERKPTDSVSSAAEEGPEPLSNVLNLLLATSVRRRAVATWRWTATAPAASSRDAVQEAPP